MISKKSVITFVPVAACVCWALVSFGFLGAGWITETSIVGCTDSRGLCVPVPAGESCYVAIIGDAEFTECEVKCDTEPYYCYDVGDACPATTCEEAKRETVIALYATGIITFASGFICMVAVIAADWCWHATTCNVPCCPA